MQLFLSPRKGGGVSYETFLAYFVLLDLFHHLLEEFLA